MKTERRSVSGFLVFGAALLAVSALLFRWTDWDLRVSGRFYLAEQREWYGNLNPFLYFYYEYGPAPPFLAFALAFAGWLLSFALPGWANFRRVFLYGLTSFVVGPLLLVNALLKGHYHRPRPYELEAFGRTEAFCPILDLCQTGQAFPSGHVAGVFGLTFLFFALAPFSRKAAWTSLGVSTLLGMLMMFTRVAQGGHFVSDTLWSWGLVLVVNALLAQAMLSHFSGRPVASARVFFDPALALAGDRAGGSLDGLRTFLSDAFSRNPPPPSGRFRASRKNRFDQGQGGFGRRECSVALR